MKLCFSTIGCPDWALVDIMTIAKDLKFDAVEIRSIRNEVYAPKMKDFATDSDIAKTKAYLEKVDVKIAMLTSNSALANHNATDALKETKEYVVLASKLGVPYVRVLSTDKPYYDGGDRELCKKQYKELCEFAKEYNVTPLIETNGLFLDSKDLADFIDEIGDNAGVLWDVHHPYRFNDEPVDVTIKNLGDRIKYVHLKDSLIEKGKPAYKLMGYGDIPVKDAIKGLLDIGYDGYFTFEWVKLWDKGLEHGGIVFANYVSFMKSLKF